MMLSDRLLRWVGVLVVFLVITNVFTDWVTLDDIRALRDTTATPQARALSQFTPTSGNLVVGTNTSPITSGAATGNVGSYRGTLASDNLYWYASSTASGLDQQLRFDGSQLNNANKLIVVFEAAALNATLSRVYQICDWSSSTGVDTAADANCTTGGWRTLNTRKTAITTATETAFTWHVYDGYWSTAANANVPLSTPLSNFVRGSDGRILLRAYSTTNCTTCRHHIDAARVDAVIDPIYLPNGLTTSTNSTVTGDYRNTINALFNGQSGSDNQYLQVAGTALITSDFYLSFRNVRTYPGMNTIVMRAEYSCSATGINHRPKIWNFNTSSWEDLTTTAIACATADATNTFAKDNITISHYVSGGEVRIGWRGLANGTQAIRIDQMYIIAGSVNSDSSQCEISFGTGTASNCANTRGIDTTLGAPTTWQQTTEAESATFGHDYFPLDNDADATSAEHAASANLWIPAAPASTTRVTGLVYAMNWRSNVTTITTQGQFKDFSGGNATVSGGWTAFGTTNAATTYTYQDSVTNGYFLSSPDDYVDTKQGRLNVRVRTTVSTNTTGVTRDIDFVFASVQWTEPSTARYTLNYRHVPQGGTLAIGSNTSPITSGATTGNVGSWRGTLASDNFYWRASSTASGLDQQVYADGVDQNGANKIIIAFEAGTNNTTLSRLYQICDWSSTTEVDHAADANCTGGGWRTLNIRKTGLTATADTLYTWHVYDGYWTTAANGNVPISTPISNFLRTSDGRLLLRAYSATSCTTCIHNIDYVRADVVADSIYLPAGFATSSTSTVTNNYRNAQNAILTGQTASDNNYLQVAGTVSSPADFYLSFKNVKTYTGMNTIMVRAESSCSTTGNTHRPKLWNFNTSSWVDLGSQAITCSATDAIASFALNNITVTDYISNGELRVGWRTISNGTQAVRLDYIYVILGAVNDDSSLCEISFGTGTATNCTNTRTIDGTTTTLSTWQQTTEAESTTFGHDYYAQDNDTDATTAEHAASANVWIDATVPTGAQVTAHTYAFNWRSNVTTITAASQMRDFGAINAAISGGWTAVGTTNAATTYTYADAITNGYFRSNAEDYLDTYANMVNFRFRTSVSTNTTGVTRDIDFVMHSLQWVEPPGAAPTITLTLNATTTTFGNLTPGTPIFGTTTAEVFGTDLDSGYQIGVKRDNNPTSTLVHSDTITQLPDATAWNGSNNATSTPGANLSFRLSTSTANFNSTWWGSGTALFAGFPTSTQTIMNCTACTGTAVTTSSINYRLDAPATQATGAYSGTVTYTALSNP